MSKNYLSLSKQLEQIEQNIPSHIHYNNWRELSSSEIKAEYDYEYPKFVQSYDINPFPNLKAFIYAVKISKVEIISHERDMKMDYRSHTDNLQDLLQMTSHYRSGVRDVPRITQGFLQNDKIPYPIVFEINNNERILSGNTRMDIAFILGFHPKAKIVLIND